MFPCHPTSSVEWHKPLGLGSRLYDQWPGEAKQKKKRIAPGGNKPQQQHDFPLQTESQLCFDISWSLPKGNYGKLEWSRAESYTKQTHQQGPFGVVDGVDVDSERRYIWR